MTTPTPEPPPPETADGKTPEAGWYVDPHLNDDNMLRYWNGTAWTKHTDSTRFAFMYTPHDGEEQNWEFDPHDWTVGEMATAERLYRQPRDELLADINEGYDAAKLVLLWLLRRRTEPDLTYNEIENLRTGALHLVQLIPATPDDDETEADPEPDAVNDPKDGSSGESDNETETPKPNANALAG